MRKHFQVSIKDGCSTKKITVYYQRQLYGTKKLLVREMLAPNSTTSD